MSDETQRMSDLDLIAAIEDLAEKAKASGHLFAASILCNLAAVTTMGTPHPRRLSEVVHDHVAQAIAGTRANRR